MNINKRTEIGDSVQKKKDPIDVALKHLAHRDRTCQEMKKHLKEKGYTTDEIVMTINYLLDMNYLNDESYIEKYMEYAVSKGKGSLKIKRELREKGIDKELLDEVLSCSEVVGLQSERKRAFAQASKIMQTIKIDDLIDDDDDFSAKVEKYKDLQRAKAKIARRLESLGYSRDVIFTTLEEVFTESFQ